MAAAIVDFSAAGENRLNPLGSKLRGFIQQALDAAEADADVTSVVLTGGKSNNFSAGADLNEFSVLGRDDGRILTLPQLVARIEGFSKPVVAAVDGVAFGGGCEIAMSCHYRVASRNAKFALPEVNVGVIPGAGGTQRLPRLVGVRKALDIILTGKHVSASDAAQHGLIDQVARPNETSLQCAQRWADWAALMPLDERRVGKQQVKDSPQHLQSLFAHAQSKLPQVRMGGEGVHAALEAVKACTLPIEQGSAVEMKHFLETLAGSQGKARRHAFFAIRKAQKPIGNPPRHHPFLSKSYASVTVGVVGAGLMGSGIAMVLLQAGFRVLLVDVYKASLDKGMAFLHRTVESYAKRGKISPENASKLMSSLSGSQKLEDCSSCQLVVEAVIENMSIKKKIFSSLEKIVPPSAILLSNTSTLDIDEMASVLSESRRSQFAGWHFFSPAHVMKLVEIVRGTATSVETLSILQHITKRIKKTGVVVGNCDGFVGNRLLIPYGAETVFLLEEGVASVSSVDKAFRQFGMALGPFEMADLAGLDIGYNIRKERGQVSIDGQPAKNRPERYPEVADVIVAKHKRLGQKTNKGWYDYDPKIGKGRKPLPSREVDALVASYATPNQRPFTPEQMIERVMFPLVNLGFLCLEEGVAQQPSDIDVVYLFGYGWPAYRGGPMFWAENEVGLPHLLETLKGLSAQFPSTDYFVPSKLLEYCVANELSIDEACTRWRSLPSLGNRQLSNL